MRSFPLKLESWSICIYARDWEATTSRPVVAGRDGNEHQQVLPKTRR